MSCIVVTCSNSFAAKRTDCPEDNKLPLPKGKVCCCQNVPDEANYYYECTVTDTCNTVESPGMIKLSGPPFCPCMFTKTSTN